LLVMDLDLCINCDYCVKACEALHGQSRLIRNRIQLGKYLIPSACRHCDDPKCMNSATPDTRSAPGAFARGHLRPVLAAVMAHGCNLGAYTMAQLTPDVTYEQLKRIADCN
jgi:ferredoxin